MILSGFRIIDFIWLQLALVFFLAFCIHILLSHLPPGFTQSSIYQLYQDLIRYGKTKNSNRPGFLQIFDIPKRWFSHFYTVSIVWNGLLLVVSVRAAVLGQELPVWLSGVLAFLTDSSAAVLEGPTLSTVLAQTLLWVHSVRRWWECVRLSVFSAGVIHVVQYAFGLCYYILLGLTVLCTDTPYQAEGAPMPALLAQLQWFHAGGILLFLWASVLQHHCMSLLAQLRTGACGEVQTLAHRVPRGGWFELVSCPHYLAEVLIYTSLCMLSHGALTWWLVVLYVLFNQALAAKLCHEFYHRKFQRYPKQRKALIPFLL